MSYLEPIWEKVRQHPSLAWFVAIVGVSVAVWKGVSQEPIISGMWKILRSVVAMPSFSQWLLLGIALISVLLMAAGLAATIGILREKRLARKAVAEPRADVAATAQLRMIYRTNWSDALSLSYGYIEYYVLDRQRSENDATSLAIDLVRRLTLTASAATHKDVFAAMNTGDPVTVDQFEAMRTCLDAAIRAYCQLWRYGLKVGQILFGDKRLPALSEYEKVYARHRGCVKSIEEVAGWSQLKTLAPWADGLDELLPAPEELIEFSPAAKPPEDPPSPTLDS